ncbi:MAG: hypothetical protein RJA31_217 [Actinomycetota bacterium]
MLGIAQPATAAVCTSWCKSAALTTSSVADFLISNDDAYYAIVTTGSVKVYTTDTRALKITVTAPTGKSFRGVRAASGGRYLFAFTDKTVVRIDLTAMTSADVTPTAFSSLWGGWTGGTWDFPVLGGIYDLLPSADGSTYYVGTNDEYFVGIRKVTVADKSITANATSDLDAGDTSATLLQLASGMVLHLDNENRNRPYGVLWSPAENYAFARVDFISGYSYYRVSATQIAYLESDLPYSMTSRLRTFNPEAMIIEMGYAAEPASLTDRFLHYSTGSAPVTPGGLVKLSDGYFYSLNLYGQVAQLIRVNSSNGVVTNLTTLPVYSGGLRRDAAGSVLVAYGISGIATVNVGSATPVPNGVTATRTATNTYAIKWNLVNLNPGLTVRDYVIQFKRTSNGKVTTYADGRSTNRTATAVAANPGHFRVQAVYSNGTYSGWSSWVARP